MRCVWKVSRRSRLIYFQGQGQRRSCEKSLILSELTTQRAESTRTLPQPPVTTGPPTRAFGPFGPENSTPASQAEGKEGSCVLYVC